MGGNFSEQDVEWNVLCDPEAAKTVFLGGVPIKAVGVDITRKCMFNERTLEYLSSLESAKYRLLVKMTEIWIDHNQERGVLPTMHDPPDEDGVELEYAVDVDVEKFMQYLCGLFREDKLT